MARIRQLYDQVPDIDCKGLCWNSCGPIDMSDAERNHISAKHGIAIQPYTPERDARWRAGEPLHCTALVDNRCTIHQDRPLICRLWGTTETVICPHGCVPTGNGDQIPAGAVLLVGDALRMLTWATEIGGGDQAATMGLVRDLLNDPTLQPLLERIAAGDRTAEQELLATLAPGPDRPSPP